MTETLLRGGLVDAGGGEFRRADVLVADGRIGAVGDATRAHGSSR